MSEESHDQHQKRIDELHEAIKDAANPLHDTKETKRAVEKVNGMLLGTVFSPDPLDIMFNIPPDYWLVTQTGRDGLSPLQRAVMLGAPEVVETILYAEKRGLQTGQITDEKVSNTAVIIEHTPLVLEKVSAPNNVDPYHQYHGMNALEIAKKQAEKWGSHPAKKETVTKVLGLIEAELRLLRDTGQLPVAFVQEGEEKIVPILFVSKVGKAALSAGDHTSLVAPPPPAKRGR